MKTNTQHTPGPWLRLHEDKLQSQTKAIVTENASMGGVGEVIAWSNNYCGRASEANARLIAAAPDLLSALQNIATIAGVCAITFPNSPGNGDFQNIVRDARAAIAKATGGQS